MIVLKNIKKMSKKYRFFLHYNKPLSKQKGTHLWSVHFRNTCYFTENIECNLPTESKLNKRQPYVVMRGFAEKVEVVDNKLIIN